MNEEIKALGQLVEIRDIVDRRIIVTLIRALLIDASQEKITSFKEYMDILQEQFEATVSEAEDEEGRAQARVGLMHFERWAAEIEHMLHERSKSLG